MKKAFALLMLVAMSTTGCALLDFGGEPKAAAKDEQTDMGYRIGAEDVLEISVWREETLKKEVLVRADGMISFPLVGELMAAGKTPDELRAELVNKLQKFVPDAVATVAVLRPGSQRIYVIGRVNKPGELPLGRHINVLQALSLAGGLTPFAAANDIKIVRQVGAESQTLRFRYGDVESGRNLEQNIVLRSGDVIVVP